MDNLINSGFVESKFMSYVDNIFIKILHAVMFNKIEEIDHFVGDDVYHELEDKLKKLNEKNLIQMYEMTNVKESKILNVEETNDKYIIEVYLVSRYVEYEMEKDTKEIVSGNDKYRVEKENYLTFEKFKKAKTQNISRKCPTCGANMDINNSGKCIYCGSIYDLEKYDFILTNIKSN